MPRHDSILKHASSIGCWGIHPNILTSVYESTPAAQLYGERWGRVRLWHLLIVGSLVVIARHPSHRTRVSMIEMSMVARSK